MCIPHNNDKDRTQYPGELWDACSHFFEEKIRLGYRVSEWVIKFNGLSQTADSEVHIVHISRVIIACTLTSLSPPT